MKSTLLHSDGGQRTFAVVFATDDEVTDGLTAFAEREDVTAASITGLGAFRRARLGYFDLERRDYDPIEVDEQVEVLSLVGNVALAQGGERKHHLHVVVGRRDGSALGGHLLAATVRPTLELVVTESPAHLRRHHDPATGLPLLPA